MAAHVRLDGTADRFDSSGTRNQPRIEKETEIDALIRLEVACTLALRALPHLPNETEQVLREPVETLCDVTRAQLDQLDPDWRA